jgi:hypothetical protein
LKFNDVYLVANFVKEQLLAVQPMNGGTQLEALK